MFPYSKSHDHFAEVDAAFGHAREFDAAHAQADGAIMVTDAVKTLSRVLEYWLVDVRDPAHPQFDILRHGARGYTATRRQAGGWLRSGVLARLFHLSQTTDPLGDPKYTLAVR